MYDGYCCYCESIVEDTGYARIEHLRPRSKFPNLCYDWNNLHYCCELCNGNKGDNWDYQNNIIDPSNENPSDHLYFKGERVYYRSERGHVTMDTVDLNRDELLNARRKILSHIFELYQDYNSIQDPVKKLEIRQKIISMSRETTPQMTYLRETIEWFDFN